MPITIASTEPNTPSAKVGLKEGDIILSINNHPIEDIVDFLFFSVESKLCIEFLRKDKKLFVDINSDENLGITPCEKPCKHCTNRCIFCFIDQNPKGLRDSLYIKDDDPIYSFYYGNYITLTNLNQKDIQKILTQKLSPLYVSVHSTDIEIHKKMLCFKRQGFDIYFLLKKLTDSGIKLHLQIVVVPSFNDGEHLSQTLSDLSGLDGVISIGIVPVGISKHRAGLARISPIDKNNALDVLRRAEGKEKVYVADEIFLKAQVDIPHYNYYDDFPQLENGIGAISLAHKNWQKLSCDFISDVDKVGDDIIFATGALAFDFLVEIVNQINRTLKTKKASVKKITNNFFGEEVGVSGLLTAKDLVEQLTGQIDVLALPSNMFNDTGLTIDDKSLRDIKTEVRAKKVILVHQYFEKWEIF